MSIPTKNKVIFHINTDLFTIVHGVEGPFDDVVTARDDHFEGSKTFLGFISELGIIFFGFFADQIVTIFKGFLCACGGSV